MKLRPATAELMCMVAALLVLLLPVEEVPPLPPVRALLLLEVQVALPWMSPLPPELSGNSFFSSVQSSSMSPVEVTVKVPTTLCREGIVTLSSTVNN